MLFFGTIFGCYSFGAVFLALFFVQFFTLWVMDEIGAGRNSHRLPVRFRLLFGGEFFVQYALMILVISPRI